MNVLHHDSTGNSTGFIKFISVMFEIYDGMYRDNTLFIQANISPDSESFEHEMGSSSFKGFNLTASVSSLEYAERKESKSKF
jgi:hypothetical protein